MKRIAILDEDGTVEIGGVRHKLVPCHITPPQDWDAMLAVTKPDLSALPVAPRPIDPESNHTITYRIAFNDALYAIGVKP